LAESKSATTNHSKRLQTWITSLPSPQKTADERRLRADHADAARSGFSQVTKVSTEGQPGIFATLDSGAPKTLASISCTTLSKLTPPSGLSALGRRARRQARPRQSNHRPRRRKPEGPEATLLAALHAIAAPAQTPSESRFRREGEEESRLSTLPSSRAPPRCPRCRKKVQRYLHALTVARTDGEVTITLAPKGVVELELISSGEKWGPARGRRALQRKRALSSEGLRWRIVASGAHVARASRDPRRLSGAALLLECTSFRGPRPHFRRWK